MHGTQATWERGGTIMLIRTTRRFLALGLTLALVLLAACGPSSPGSGSAAPQPTEADIDLTAPVAITIWHNQTGPLAAAFQKMVDDFNAGNGKGISVKLEFQGNYTQIYQKALGAIQAGALPEGIVGVENQVAEYAKAGVIVDLDPYLKSPKNGLSKQSLDDIYKPYLDSNRYPQYDNKLLSFPFVKSLEVNYVNNDLLKQLGLQAPKTWDEFERAAKAAKLAGSDGRVTRWGWMASGTEAFLAGVMTRGGRILSADGSKVAWDGREGLDQLRLIERCIAEAWCYIPKGFDWQNHFGTGNLLFATGTSTGRPFIRAAFKSPIDWGVLGMPSAGSGKAGTIQFGGVVAITKSTPEKQLAVWEFLKWFTDTKQTARWATETSYMPVRRSAADDAGLKAHYASKDPQGQQSFDLVPTSVPGPSIRGWSEIREVIFEMLTKVHTKKAPADVALKEAATKANQILADTR